MTNTPKYEVGDEGNTVISDRCLDCPYLKVEDIWYEFICYKRTCPYEVCNNKK